MDRCALGPPDGIIAVSDPKPGELQAVFDLADRPELWRTAPESPALSAYRAAVTRRLGGPPEQRALLERQHAIYAAVPSGQKDAANTRLVLDGLGTVAPASCLEAALWKAQNARFPMLTHPTEFGAFILRRPGRVRVYFSSMDRLGQKIRHEVTDRIDHDVAAGWTVAAHLHVHPFLFGRVPGDRMWTQPFNVNDVGGAVAPSSNDVHFYRSLRADAGLREAWITNGFVTGHFPAETFGKFASASCQRRVGASGQLALRASVLRRGAGPVTVSAP